MCTGQSQGTEVSKGLPSEILAAIEIEAYLILCFFTISTMYDPQTTESNTDGYIYTTIVVMVLFEGATGHRRLTVFDEADDRS